MRLCVITKPHFALFWYSIMENLHFMRCYAIKNRSITGTNPSSSQEAVT